MLTDADAGGGGGWVGAADGRARGDGEERKRMGKNGNGKEGRGGKKRGKKREGGGERKGEREKEKESVRSYLVHSILYKRAARTGAMLMLMLTLGGGSGRAMLMACWRGGGVGGGGPDLQNHADVIYERSLRQCPFRTLSTSSSRTRHGAPKANDRFAYYWLYCRYLLQGTCVRYYTGRYTPLRVRRREFWPHSLVNRSHLMTGFHS